MSSIIRDGDTFHGIRVFGRGVFTNDEYGYVRTYAGQHRDGYACGLGVLKWSDGYKGYAEYGPDGQFDGRYLRRDADRDTTAARRRPTHSCTPTAAAIATTRLARRTIRAYLR
jgi:hypothetical protein